MKRIILFLPLLIASLTGMAKEPSWLTDRTSGTAYIGVGSATMDKQGWEQMAEQSALGDLARQISVLIESNSFLATMELNKADQEFFAQATQASAKNLLEGYELVGTYKDKKANTCFVCYQLDKETYQRNKAKKEKEIADAGYGYLKEAQNALDNGDLFRSLTFYEKGLEVVEPWLFLDLRATYGGQRIDVPNALYSGYLSAFDGLELMVEPAAMTLADGPVGEDIKVRLTRRGTKVVNMPVVASFIEGSGVISDTRRTDGEGVASFRLTAITGKERVAQIRFALSNEVQKGLSAGYKRLMSIQTWPEAICRIEKENKAKIAYLHNAGCDLDRLIPQLTALLGNNHFTITPDPDEAEIFVEVRNSVDYAGVVPGEIYNLNESYVNLQMKFYDNGTQHLLYTYSVEQLRVLSPEKNTVDQTMAQCMRELMKRVQKELPKKLTFNN